MENDEQTSDLKQESWDLEQEGLQTARLEAVADELPTELTEIQAQSIVESVLFASPIPMTLKMVCDIFNGTNIDDQKVKEIINLLQTDYAGGDRGVELAEIGGGYQIRTKADNTGWIKKMVKGRSFRLSGPALEVLSIVAYKQPVIKSEVDQIRGVESGHLIRALMEKNLIKFAGKSELPGKPMLYGTTKEFLELFGLRNIRELPTLAEIAELLPEGMGDTQDVSGLENETLGTLSEKIGLPMGKSYSDSESELLTITDELSQISSTTEFFEQEKLREKQKREAEKAQDLRERKIVGEALTEEEEKWLARFDTKVMEQAGI